jgi:hypothetical protein
MDLASEKRTSAGPIGEQFEVTERTTRTIVSAAANDYDHHSYVV